MTSLYSIQEFLWLIALNNSMAVLSQSITGQVANVSKITPIICAVDQ
jgi:hypothetical protein